MNSEKNLWARVLFLFCIWIGFTGCSISVSDSKGIANPDVVVGQQLLNGSFETETSKHRPEFWEVKNEALGIFQIQMKPNERDGRACYVKLTGSSDYGRTFMLFQVLNPAALRGKIVSFGGEVKVPNARVYLRLWSPEGNSQVEVKNSSTYRLVHKNYEVPENASLVIFAVEVVGKKGDEAWMDNLYTGRPTETESTKDAISRDDLNIITIDPSSRLGKISPLKFGGHMEWINAGHGLWNIKNAALEKRMIDLLKPLHIPIWRFPGGIYSDYYDWRDGVGDSAKRPMAIDPFDQKTRHQHCFGTDEFIEFLSNTNSEALITINYGTGNLEMATSWLQYFKTKGIKVQYWEIGNEIYMADPDNPNTANGSRIFHTAREYTDDFVHWADALRAIDKDIMVGAIGGISNTHASNRGWMDTLLKGAGDEIDFIALHNAFAPAIGGRFDYTSENNRLRAYRAMLAQVEDMKADIASVKRKLKQYLPDRADRILIAITEHFPIFGFHEKDNQTQFLQNIDQTRTMAAALYTATILTAIVNDPQIFMANYLNPVHRYYGSLLNESDEGISKNPVYYIFYMFRNYFGDDAVFSKFEGSTFSTSAVGIVPPMHNAPLLEVAASRRNDGTITVAVVNKDMENSQSAKISLLGKQKVVSVQLHTLSSQWPNAVTAPPLSKSTRRQKGIENEQRSIKWTTEQVITFPPCSFNILELHIAVVQ